MGNDINIMIPLLITGMIFFGGIALFFIIEILAIGLWSAILLPTPLSTQLLRFKLRERKCVRGYNN